MKQYLDLMQRVLDVTDQRALVLERCHFGVGLVQHLLQFGLCHERTSGFRVLAERIRTTGN